MEVGWDLKEGLKLALSGEAGRHASKLRLPFPALTEGLKRRWNQEGTPLEEGTDW